MKHLAAMTPEQEAAIRKAALDYAQAVGGIWDHGGHVLDLLMDRIRAALEADK